MIEKENLIKGSLIGLLGLILVTIDIIVEIGYYINELNYDRYKYLTLIMICIFIITISFTIIKSTKNKRKIDLNNLEDRAKLKIKIDKYSKLSLVNITFTILDIVYYGYMFYIIFLSSMLIK
ncbi:hypothetical protein BJV85_002785 [Clostridium acetobutylicum]|uniref:Predicted membrane protein n=1 Tax=Clostridium acetobutylicum (strain ATCC 824 / DSM 792 / JCM 1419 / IAM 19013 / LMG 5710 / NBRC 13948 / NRRL B-527 / VKM B-1787 / 2291 / W) TaxID=272562 RepID=Q97JR0_CLOAB|nr:MULTISPECIES: hypothetical protein [Clostridium]AAK79185.1 Predicted membrane protein [Clostridium acetobutylicum ATCC 824]ADZ20263.1 membrane protein [Clostridium acetobutylicum EA 2018]AEI31715.1 hypothetical protein SMB_G1233 [Clostridium acetobutylicum DSM 1731]AWV81564.1 hypothetical protein DK921_15985 [Clostridium acetobutylicum]MBC2393204.1 hypothetical protein [Clostridium acetobutylicum]